MSFVKEVLFKLLLLDWRSEGGPLVVVLSQDPREGRVVLNNV